MSPPAGQYSQICAGEELPLHVYGYKKTLLRTVLYYLLCVISLGIFRLVSHWKAEWMLYLRAIKSPQDIADYLLIIDQHATISVREVREVVRKEGLALPREEGGMEIVQHFRFFSFRKCIFIWMEEKKAFLLPSLTYASMPLGVLSDEIESGNGLCCDEVERRKGTFGRNLIEVKVRPILMLLFREAISPFYIFQVFSVSVWYTDNYIYYATIIVLISLSSIAVDVYQTRSQETKLRSMVHSCDFIQVVRAGKEESIPSEELVPGDVMIIPRHGCILQCDAMLINGTVIVAESMLTGESVPVTKVPLTVNEDEKSEKLDVEKHAKHTLFCGTEVLQTRFYKGQEVKAVVLRTAFSTLKGQLVRSIMYPKPIDFRFTRDLFKFVGFLACLAAGGFAYTFVVMSLRGVGLRTIIIRSLDIITIVVPPALPAAMSVGIISAQLRLRKKNIFCISPSTINTCGAVNVVCFDKTGTLTEDGLDFHKARSVIRSAQDTLIDRSGESVMVRFDEEAGLLEAGLHGELVKALAACHSLTRINGVLHGDPLDLVLFERTRWTLRETADNAPQPEEELYDTIQRMSVIVQSPRAEDTHQMILYSKGSPEMIRSLCSARSVPSNYEDIISSYACLGLRIIAVARAALDISFVKAHKVKRELVERDMELLGVVILENRIKEKTTDVIHQLSRSNKRAYIVEHTEKEREGGEKEYKLTLRLEADSINKVPHSSKDKYADIEKVLSRNETVSYQLIISGATFAIIVHEYPDLIESLVASTAVFARMAPDQKRALIHHLQAAHAGISLSEAEASIAAPFTSATPDISCVAAVIAEGRAALVTSFGVFQYMAGYSLTQFITILHLYSISTNLGDMQFLYIDLFLITLVAVFFGNTPACQTLSSRAPPTRLLTLPTILSVSGQLIIIGATQLFVFFDVKAQSWYEPFIPDPHNDAKPSQQGTALFHVTTFQYIMLAIIYSKGYPFRQRLFSNRPLCVSLLIQTVVSLLILLFHIPFVASFLHLIPPPAFTDRLLLLLIAAISVCFCFIFEKIVIARFYEYIQSRTRAARIRSGRFSNCAKYERITYCISDDPNWILAANERKEGEVARMNGSAAFTAISYHTAAIEREGNGLGGMDSAPVSPSVTHDNPLKPLHPDNF